MDETRHALPVELQEPIQLEGTDTRAQLLTIGGVILTALVCVGGVIGIEVTGGSVPAVLEGVTYTLAGALAGMLTQRR